MGRGATERGVDEPRDVSRPVEKRDAGAVIEEAETQGGDGRLESGAEDPAFFIKPSE